MKTVDSLYFVSKIAGYYYVADWNGNIEIGYKSKKDAENYAAGGTHMIFTEAELLNERLDRINAYLKSREGRVYKPFAQYEMDI